MSGTNSSSDFSLQKSLPSSYYLSREIFALEKEKIFCREWFCAGREEQIPNPGDVLVLDVAGECILVVRTREGVVKAHYNVCRHRGARLIPLPGEEEKGDIKFSGGVMGTNGIRCSYHHWTYTLDGRLVSAPYAREGEGFCKADYSLYPVGVELWGGFLFLNLTPEGQRRKDTLLKHSLVMRWSG